MIIFNEKKIKEFLRKTIEELLEGIFLILELLRTRQDMQHQRIKKLEKEVEGLKKTIDYQIQNNIEQNKKILER